MLTWEPYKILSYGVGTPSTTLALMACENKLAGRAIHPLVPVYDFIIFCDLHGEPSWVYQQAAFVKDVCQKAGLAFITLDADLYGDFTRNFGQRRVAAIPFWTIGPDGKKGKMPRQCTVDYKIKVIEKYMRYDVLGYRPRERVKPWDENFHEMHMGIMWEERQRAKESRSKLFTNVYPLVEMGWNHARCYQYNKDIWALETKASACLFCPFHTNYFYAYIKEHEPDCYACACHVDSLLESNQAIPQLKSKLYLTKENKRLYELKPEDCMDAQFFMYQNRPVWNGF